MEPRLQEQDLRHKSGWHMGDRRAAQFAFGAVSSAYGLQLLAASAWVAFAVHTQTMRSSARPVRELLKKTMPSR